MGEENKKSFWTSLPGILTGVAAIIAAVTGIVVAYHPTTPPPPPPSSSSSELPTSTPSSQPSSISSSQQHLTCGEQLPEVILIGSSWRWSGNVHDTSQSGVLTFKSNCTYVNVPKSVSTTPDEGKYLVNSTPSSITFTNNASGEKHTYLISGISENSFHASSPDLTINLDFFRAS